MREQELRNFLGSFNFNGAMATSPITPFSGGEGAAGAGADRLAAPQPAAAGRTHQPPGPGTREALTSALAQFEGTLVLVSHDRHLLRASTDQFIIVADGQVRPFDGDLDDYKAWLYQTSCPPRRPEAARRPAWRGSRAGLARV